MKVFLRLLCPSLFLLATASGGDLRENDFFKRLEGEWKGRGEMTNAEGNTSRLENRIETGFANDGRMFYIVGGLVIGEPGENEPLDYRWEFTELPTAGLYHGTFINQNQDGERRQFEVSINEVELKAKLTETSASGGGSRIELVKEIEDGQYLVDFEFIDSGGNTNLEGHLEFERAE